MLKEIAEQPQAIADTLLGRIGENGRLQLDEMRLSDDELRAIDKIIIIAAGTSFHAGLVAKYAIEHWTRIPCEVDLASEFRYRDPIIDRDTMVIAISQSGETHGHADGPPARTPATREGARHLQHQRGDDSARVRRRHLHPRRPRDRRRVDEGVPDADRRLPAAGALPRAGAGHEVRRRDRGDRARGSSSCRPTSSGCSRRWSPSAHLRESSPTPSRCSSWVVTSATRSLSRARSSSKSSRTCTPRGLLQASSSTARSP